MSSSVASSFDDRTLLQIASADFSIDRANEAWAMLLTRHIHTRALIDSIEGTPCERLLPLLGSRREILSLDDDMQERCRTETEIAWGLNIRLFDVIGATLEEWKREGVSPVALKGLALVGDTYRLHHHRHVGDADFLIQQNEIRPALDVLSRNDWQVPWRAIDRLRFGATALGIRHPSGVGLDLHLRPCRNVPYEIPPARWASEPVPTNHPLSAADMRRLVPVEHLLVLCAHAARPENAHLAHPLVDLYRLVVDLVENENGAPEQLVRMARRFHLEFRSCRVIERVRDVFDPAFLGEFADLNLLDHPSSTERRAVEAERRRGERLLQPPTPRRHKGPVVTRVRDEVTVTTVGQPWTRRWTQIWSYVWQKSLLLIDARRWRARTRSMT